MEIKLILSAFIAILALVNPVQKIFVITSLQNQFADKELKYLSLKASITAFIILVVVLSLGQIIFNYVFHIQL